MDLQRFAATFAALWTLTVTATSAVALDADALMLQAAKVVRGTVLSTDASWVDGRIFTRVTVDVAETLKGSDEPRLVVQIPGGAVDGFVQRVSGAPTLKVGEEVVLFVEPTSASDSARVLGLSQGKMRVERDRAGNVTLIPDTNHELHRVGTKVLLPMKLTELRERLGVVR